MGRKWLVHGLRVSLFSSSLLSATCFLSVTPRQAGDLAALHDDFIPHWELQHWRYKMPLSTQKFSINSSLLLQVWSLQHFGRENKYHHEMGTSSQWLLLLLTEQQQRLYNQNMAGQGRVKHKINSTNVFIITLAQAPNPFELQDQPGISLLKQVMKKQGIYFSLAVKLCSSFKQNVIFAFKEVKKKFHGKTTFLF